MFYMLLFGLLVFAAGYLAVAQTVGKRRGLVWGLLVIPFPLVSIVFGFSDWKWLKRPFIVLTTGLLVAALAMAGGGIHEAENRLRKYGFDETVERSTDLADKARTYVFGVNSNAPANYGSTAPVTAEVASSEALTSLPSQTLGSGAVRVQGSQFSAPGRLAFQQRDIDLADHFIGHRVRVHLNNGLIREATLISKERSRLLLKHQARSGYVSYEIPMGIVSDFFVRLPTKESDKS